MISAANALDNNKVIINNMNVFPVPDGDTGINMTLTMSTIRALENFDGTISDCADKIAGMVLRAACGNSGAILSLFFRGVAKSLRGLDTADSADIARAFKKGTEEAYRAVVNPTEGTMLTVMRLSAEKAVEVTKTNYKGDVTEFFAFLVDAAKEALAATPDMLPVLKEVNLVDAGGYGFVSVLEGMLAALNKNPIIAAENFNTIKEAVFSDFETGDITYCYCTELIVEKNPEFQGEGKVGELSEYIMTLGDSMVFVDDEQIAKLHIHTNNPGLVIEKALTFGSLSMVKIENMRNQHSNISFAETHNSEPAKKAEVLAPEKPYGFVSVCMGGGISDTFRDLGADNIIFGGQTMNPSTQDIIDGINMTPAETVFILPNNKNIYLVACEAAKIVTDKNVIVLSTKSVPQGIAAMIAFDESLSLEENLGNMNRAIAGVKSMSVTQSVRDTTLAGEKISNGQLLGIIDGNIQCVADTNEDCIGKLAENMKQASFVTIFYGSDVTETEAGRALDIVKSKVDTNAEINLLSGGQPIYNYIISVE